ncbi:MAG TPA: DUF2332 domain-containing protein [Mycobacteriales bacterium]|nr:DUF2332 domain-containing protein [Mycobacteriales bacterium]
MAHPLSGAFREQAAGCLPGSPLYGRLLAAMADDLDAGGVTADVLAGRERDRPGTVPPLRLLGGLHRLVLTGRAPHLARYYPSAGGAEPPGRVWSAAEPALRAHLTELRQLLDRTVQTNEPGRACLLYGGLLVAAQRAGAAQLSAAGIRSAGARAAGVREVEAREVGAGAVEARAAGARGAGAREAAAPAAEARGAGAREAAAPADGESAAGGLVAGRGAVDADASAAAVGAGHARSAGMPVRLLEVGASAGLIMLVDRYGYAVGDRVLGGAGSPLRFEQPWVGVPAADLDLPVEIVERRGCDPNPIDPGTAEGRLTLLSYVWPDWTERVDRLVSALQLAAVAPPPVDRAGMAGWLGSQLASPRPGVLTVVWHSVVRQYIDFPERDAGRAVLARAAAAATPEAPLAYLRFEQRRRPDRRLQFELVLTCWPGDGRDELLAIAPGHGIPATWQ